MSHFNRVCRWLCEFIRFFFPPVTPLCTIFLLFFSLREAIRHSLKFMCKRFDCSVQYKWNDIFKQRWFPLRQYVLQLEHIFQYQPGTNIFQIRYGKQFRFCLRVRWRIPVLTFDRAISWKFFACSHYKLIQSAFCHLHQRWLNCKVWICSKLPR